ncbi:MAG: hypothetical protein HY843_07890 [Bdellovibrio sp.]|nr:hypothetical protein [Bdellovibrio sp.]
MAKAEIKRVLDVSKRALFQTITKYEDYPQFVSGCKSVDIERENETKARVKYLVSIMKDVSYVLNHDENFETGEIQWSLVEGDFFQKNTGSWKLKEIGPEKTEAVYSIEVEFNVPVPSFILNRLIKGSLPEMMKNFEKRAKDQGKGE